MCASQPPVTICCNVSLPFSFGLGRCYSRFCICTDGRALLQKWEDRIKHAQDSAAHQDELASDVAREVPPEEAAFMALKKWASTGRKCRQALKRANPTAVEDMELHYLQFMRQVGTMADSACLQSAVVLQDIHAVLGMFSDSVQTAHFCPFLPVSAVVTTVQVAG